ncbi:MAG TPA: carbohydrate-binding domain-containing protein, partial [Paludibacteraceae bacterium]|nr:carbohydrate-binding domain-containing protein [Paludibacteraceae bacterium]
MKKLHKILIMSMLLISLSNCVTKIPEPPKDIDSDFVEDHTFDTPVVITFNENSVTANPASVSGITFTINEGHIVVNSEHTNVEYILTGNTKNGSFKLYSTSKCKLTLKNVHIESDNSPAINIQTSKSIFVNIANGTENTLSDKNPYILTELEDAKGTFFSEGQLIFSGTGSLQIASKQAHGIITDDYIRIRSGEIRINEAVKDGFSAKDHILIEGGDIYLIVSDDGISCRQGYITIEDGNITVESMDEGIVAGYDPETDLVIEGVVPDITINGGAITIKTDGARGHGIKSVGMITFNGGNT